MAEMTLERIAELEVLEMAATPGPYTIWSGNPWHADAANPSERFPNGKKQVFTTGHNDFDRGKADVRFLAELRNECQALLSLARRALEQPSGVVTREHREAAASLVKTTSSRRALDRGEFSLNQLSQLLANHEAAAYERGKREGAEPWELLLKHSRDSDPERAGNGPTICLTHDGDDFERPANIWVHGEDTDDEHARATATEAAAALCVTLGLKEEGK